MFDAVSIISRVYGLWELIETSPFAIENKETRLVAEKEGKRGRGEGRNGGKGRDGGQRFLISGALFL